jgi:hypothetical protein
MLKDINILLVQVNYHGHDSEYNDVSQPWNLPQALRRAFSALALGLESVTLQSNTEHR